MKFFSQVLTDLLLAMYIVLGCLFWVLEKVQVEPLSHVLLENGQMITVDILSA
jgi:F0F1-type ATP synthase membrane subunit b/b'